MLNKNDEIILTIEDLGIDGAGIGKSNGFPIFVKGALIGDTIKCGITKIKKTYGYGRVIEVIKNSPNRVCAMCSIAGPCGGCQLQSLDYNAQLEFKTNKVLNNMVRLGRQNCEISTNFINLDNKQISNENFNERNLKNVENNNMQHYEAIENNNSCNSIAALNNDTKPRNSKVYINKCIGMDEPWRYRNKAQVPFGYDKNGKLIAGFYAGHTHSVIPVEDCKIGPIEFTDIINIIKEYMIANNVSAYDEKTCKGVVRHALLRKGFGTGEILVCLVINKNHLPAADKLIEELVKVPGMASISININKENTNVILGDRTKTIWGTDQITDTIGDLKFKISPQSFFQINHIQTEKLYKTALDFAGLTGNEIVWDLYCGAGTISLFLARQSKKVYGVEIVEPAIADAIENAKLNNILNADFICGAAEKIAPNMAKDENCKPDVVVVDPPRKGCDSDCLNAILEMAPDRIVYVSCDSATLARDVKYLSDNGYELNKVQPVDMFPHTVHVETVALLSKVKG